MNEEGLASLFKEHSLSYSSLSIPVWKYGPRKGKGRGYAFATVSTEEEQTKAIETLNGKEIHTGEMYTPRTPVAAQAEAAQLTEGAIAAPDDTPAAPAEPIERVLKVVARQGYENEDQNREQEHEEEGNAAAAADAAANAGTNGNAGEL
jgi:RNA recognition motif-containing protein